MSSASNDSHSDGMREGNNAITADEYSKYCKIRALDKIIRATQSLSAGDRQAVLQLAVGPNIIICHLCNWSYLGEEYCYVTDRTSTETDRTCPAVHFMGA